MDPIHVSSPHQRVVVDPEVFPPTGWSGSLVDMWRDTGTNRLTFECASDAEIQTTTAELRAALRTLPDPVDLVARQDEPPEGT